MFNRNLVLHYYLFQFSFCFILEQLHYILKTIQTEMITTRLTNERILCKISSLKNDVTKLARHIMVPIGLAFTNDMEDKEFLEQLPFSNWENVLACERALQTSNNDVKEKFVC